mgnify:CR=1 FL=1
MNEGFKTASQVNYMARCGTFAGLPYTGAFKVLKVILNYEYLWLNLRVKGGAYGCMSSFGRNGELRWYPTVIRIWGQPMQSTRESRSI